MAVEQYKRWMCALLCGATILLVGCNESKSVAAAEAVANTALQAALNEAKAVKDPWDAFKLLGSREKDLISSNPCYEKICRGGPAWDAIREERVRLLGLALDQNQTEALYYLYASDFPYASNSYISDEYDQLRRESVPKLLAYADKANGKVEDRPLLLLAGNLVSDGKEVMHDTSRAAGYYARAWAAGEPKAANNVANLFLEINDVRNAYLWSLRCIGDCKRSSEVHLNTLEAALTPEAAKQIQRLAAMPSVVELDAIGN